MSLRKATRDALTLESLRAQCVAVGVPEQVIVDAVRIADAVGLDPAETLRLVIRTHLRFDPLRGECANVRRAAMTEEEFWEDVAAGLVPGSSGTPERDYGSEVRWIAEESACGECESLDAAPCLTCGSTGACGYDSEGRALIHATPADEQGVDIPT